ncbi:hypothetical protein [Pontibacillus yanchengensis]|uniref:hypothetical protein n=1 Tax=Pontibacillus yanchengensis TaxID=462910 RepID=UPI00136B8239|nr:hypothetical protein [Pontibacillus yanchengensis]
MGYIQAVTDLYEQLEGEFKELSAELKKRYGSAPQGKRRLHFCFLRNAARYERTFSGLNTIRPSSINVYRHIRRMAGRRA